jgi:hypothetical protein
MSKKYTLTFRVKRYNNAELYTEIAVVNVIDESYDVPLLPKHVKFTTLENKSLIIKRKNVLSLSEL